MVRDPLKTLHVYVIGDGIPPKRLATAKEVWEEFRLKFWQKSLDNRRNGHKSPKIQDWDYHRDHGIVRLATRDDLLLMQPLVTTVQVKVQDVEYKLKAYEETELPVWVMLTVQLHKKGMLPPGAEQETVARDLIEMAKEDNNWPADGDGEVRAELSSYKWTQHTDAEGNPLDKGHWLIRFKVSPIIAEHIRREQKGQIYMLTDSFGVYHQNQPWRGGDRQAAVISECDPE